MTKKKILIFILIVFLALFFVKAFNTWRIDNYKTEVIKQLAEFYSQHKKYPKNLNEIPVGEKFEFFYFTNKDRNFYTIKYITGIISCNSNEYNSKSKIWVLHFKY